MDNTKDGIRIQIETVIEKIKQAEWRDKEMWHYWRGVLYELDPNNPILELGFPGLPYFRGLID